MLDVVLGWVIGPKESLCKHTRPTTLVLLIRLRIGSCLVQNDLSSSDYVFSSVLGSDNIPSSVQSSDEDLLKDLLGRSHDLRVGLGFIGPFGLLDQSGPILVPPSAWRSFPAWQIGHSQGRGGARRAALAAQKLPRVAVRRRRTFSPYLDQFLGRSLSFYRVSP